MDTPRAPSSPLAAKLKRAEECDADAELAFERGELERHQALRAENMRLVAEVVAALLEEGAPRRVTE